MFSIFPSPILVATTLIAWRAGQTVWLLVDTITTIIVGTSLLLTPHFLLEYQTYAQIDYASLYLAKVLGLFFLSSSVVSHRAFASGDIQQRSSVSASRAITACMLALIATYAYIHYPEWNSRLFYFSLVGSICWALPHLWYAMITSSHGKRETYHVKVFLILDHFICQIVGLSWAAFPQWLLRIHMKIKPNGISVTLARVLGAMLIGTSSMSISALNFSTFHSKQCIHWTRIMTSLGLIFLIIQSQIEDDTFTTRQFLAGIGICLFWGLNSLLGYIVIAYIQFGDREKERVRQEQKEWTDMNGGHSGEDNHSIRQCSRGSFQTCEINEGIAAKDVSFRRYPAPLTSLKR